DEQVAGWRLVTDAVHAEGGLIVLQLWHVGRISHVDLQPGGGKPVSASAIRAEGAKTYVSAESGLIDVSEPRALETDEVAGVVGDFRAAAERAKAAGFDGVEIHGANGYLLDQFLQPGSNKRDDRYGGSVENRARFCLEVAEAVCGVWGAGRIGYRISPFGTFSDMGKDLTDDAIVETWGHLVDGLGAMGLSYLHAVETDAQFGGERSDRTESMLEKIRARFKGAGGSAYIGCGGYTPELAHMKVAEGETDAAVFGKMFISNPDLRKRIGLGGPYAEWDQTTFYGGTEKGYTDYPVLG
ncbi:MAG: alkene reductase, partial [Pseudomonadota bacterium]